MSRQLNLRVSDAFAARLERVARQAGKPMATVLEAVGTPALELAEADARFEEEALAAWEEYQLNGASIAAESLHSDFDAALARAAHVASRRKER